MAGTYPAYTRVISSPLGDLWLCATDKGVCAIHFGDPDAKTLRGLRRYGVAPAPASPHPILDAAAAQLAEYFSGERREFTVPLDLLGTPFQRSVWEALLAIPYGETHTYGGLAILLGKPGAARAVGRAVGTNRVNIMVPCHRVIGRDGTLTGYGGGLERKRTLLHLEGVMLEV